MATQADGGGQDQDRLTVACLPRARDRTCAEKRGRARPRTGAQGSLDGAWSGLRPSEERAAAAPPGRGNDGPRAALARLPKSNGEPAASCGILTVSEAAGGAGN
jgi:hypothetical protein